MSERTTERTEPIDSSRRFKAVLHGVPDIKVPRQWLLVTREQARSWARTVAFEGLTAEQRKAAFVRISELCAVAVEDIHPAIEEGHFAVTEYDRGEVIAPDAAAMVVPHDRS